MQKYRIDPTQRDARGTGHEAKKVDAAGSKRQRLTGPTGGIFLSCISERTMADRSRPRELCMYIHCPSWTHKCKESNQLHRSVGATYCATSGQARIEISLCALVPCAVAELRCVLLSAPHCSALRALGPKACVTAKQGSWKRRFFAFTLRARQDGGVCNGRMEKNDLGTLIDAKVC
jgi:hypothetical protein